MVAGAFYLLTFVSIPTLALYGPVPDADYIVGTGPETPVVIGGVLEVIVALACIGTAVVLYPVVRSQAKPSRWASSAPGFWKPPPSSSASPAC